MTVESYLLQFFDFGHLPPQLQEVSKPFHDLAHHLDSTLPLNAEKTTALRKLVEAKDCAVRAVLFKPV
jgi:ferritin-like protein